MGGGGEGYGLWQETIDSKIEKRQEKRRKAKEMRHKARDKRQGNEKEYKDERTNAVRTLI